MTKSNAPSSPLPTWRCVVALGAAGREIEGPMAAVIIGGLTTSTLLVLLVLPGLALRFARFESPDVAD